MKAIRRASLRSRRVARGRLRQAPSARARAIVRVPLAVARTAASLAGGIAFAAWAAAYHAADRLADGRIDWYFRLRRRWTTWSIAAAERAPEADVWHGHDLSGLRAALAASELRGGKVVYDSHEIVLDSAAFVLLPRPLRWTLRRMERKAVRRTSAMITVNDMLENVLSKRYRPNRTVVVHNCPPRSTSTAPATDVLRAAADIPSGAPVALYHGGLGPHRGIEETAEALLQPGLEDVHLVVLGYGSLRDQFAALAAEPRFGGRFHLLDAVAPDRVVETIRTASVAVMALQPSTLNHWLSTPNKLFEAMAAELPIVASDFPGCRRLVMEDASGPFGVVCDPTDPAAIARAIRAILDMPPDERAAMQQRMRRAAAERWNWEAQSAGLVKLYREIAPLPARPAPASRARKPVASTVPPRLRRTENGRAARRRSELRRR